MTLGTGEAWQFVPGAGWVKDLLLRGQDHFRQHGIHRQLCHLSTRLKKKGKAEASFPSSSFHHYRSPWPHHRGVPGAIRLFFTLSQPTLSPHRGEFSKVVEGSKCIKLFQSQQQGLIRWRVQEVEVHEVMDAWGKE